MNVPSYACACGEPRSDRDVELVLARQPTGEHFMHPPKHDEPVVRLIALDGDKLPEVRLLCCASCGAVYAQVHT